MAFKTVWFIVMKTKEKAKLDFERRPQYQGLDYYFNKERSFKEFENEQFIVPWQMEKTKKNELLLE